MWGAKDITVTQTWPLFLSSQSGRREVTYNMQIILQQQLWSECWEPVTEPQISQKEKGKRFQAEGRAWIKASMAQSYKGIFRELKVAPFACII